MKKLLLSFSVILFSLFVLHGYSQDKAYKDGSVWEVTFIKTNAGMGDTYLKDLKATWRNLNDEAKNQGLILSYKILQGAAANPEDWDIMLLIEYKNLATMESSEDKWDAIYKSKIGDEEAAKKIRESRVNVRSIYGAKLMREVVYQ